MAYTIKGLAKANECEQSAWGLAELWDEWYICNCGGRGDVLSDFKSLRKADRKEMLDFLRGDSRWCEIYNHIVSHIY